MTTHSLVLLHTSPVHVATFDRLLAYIAPTQSVTHLVREDLLADARREGLSPAVCARVNQVVQGAKGDGGDVVLCTCSTIGALSEAAGGMRIDRPMAEKAVALGERIIVAATLASTIAPTRALILESAEKAGKKVTLIELVIDGAFDRFEAGDLEGYAVTIAQKLEEVAPQGDVFVLAQASMAGAIERCTGVAIPILSSPQLGLQAALAAAAAPSASHRKRPHKNKEPK